MMGVERVRQTWPGLQVALLLSLMCLLLPVRAEPVAMQLELYEPVSDEAAHFVALNRDGGPAIERDHGGRWLRLRPLGAYSKQPMVLSISGVHYGTFSVHLGDADAPDRVPGGGGPVMPGLTPMAPQLNVYALPTSLAVGTPLWVHLDAFPVEASVPFMAVEPLTTAMARHLHWLGLTSSALGILFAMSVMALVFALLLRDRAYLLYAVYLACFIVIELLETGLGFEMLGWNRSDTLLPVIGRLVTVGGVVFACLFLDAFTRLARHVRLAHRLIQGYVLVFLLCTLIGVLPVPVLVHAARDMLGPMMALGALLVPICAVCAVIAGSRYGLYFLLGWLPLMVATFVTSMVDARIGLPWVWHRETVLMAGTFEALVLSIGLGDRALSMRREFRRTRRLSQTDPLTGLLNRRGWLDMAQSRMAHAGQGGKPLYLLFIDLDHFKSLNDTFGHSDGDLALKRTAAVLREGAPPQSLLGRHGGEEFVMLTALDDLQQASDVAERLRSSLHELAIPVNRDGGRLTMSVGLTAIRQQEQLEAAMARADHGMYAAKTGGRNRVVVDEPPPAGPAA